MKEVMRERFSARILLADDSVISQYLVQTMLEELGCEVDVAKHGKAAIELASSRHHDLVLMDCEMPVMDGYDAAKILRERERFRILAGTVQRPSKLRGRLPIVAITGTQDHKEHCFASGMDDFLQKPVEIKDLRDCLSRWLFEKSDREISRRSEDSQESCAPQKKRFDYDTMDCVETVDTSHTENPIDRVVDRYFWSSEKQLALLRKAVVLGDADAIRTTAHTLKSNSAFMGAMELATLCKSLEIMARKNSTYKAAETYLELESEFKKAKKSLRSECRRDRSGSSLPTAVWQMRGHALEHENVI